VIGVEQWAEIRRLYFVDAAAATGAASNARHSKALAASLASHRCRPRPFAERVAESATGRSGRSRRTRPRVTLKRTG
jgi:hypothetical protein